MTKTKSKWLVSLLAILLVVGMLLPTYLSFAAYNHNGDTDSVNFRTVYPDKIGTKLDSCTLCHSGGSYTSGSPPKTTKLGSCQWCHYITNYGDNASEANLLLTLNQYGLDYKNNGRNSAALMAIQNIDSDADGFANLAEINALTYPGDLNDNPANVLAPSRIFTLQELELMPQYSEFLLMNASKSDDAYVEYSGIIMEDLIKALKLDSATGITVYSPDGFATYHPFSPTANPNSYNVFGTYPSAVFHYNTQADMATNPSTGWCNYSAPSVAGKSNGDAIVNPLGLKMLLAFKRDGQYLTTGVLNSQNKLDGEGPFRVVPPQKNPGPPDQRSTATKATDPNTWVWPYVSSADHNAGFSSRTVTMIKVEPLPAGTTDINTLEAGWPYVDEGKIIIYGAIDPNPVNKLVTSLDNLKDTIQSIQDSSFKNKSSKKALINKVEAVEKQVAAKAYNGALNKLQEDVLQKTDGFVVQGYLDANDWVIDPVIQRQLYSDLSQIWILLLLVS